MKRTLPISIIAVVGGVFAALCLSQIAFSKAHVPARKGQICAQGNVLTVSEGAVRGFQQRGTSGSACVLPACDFANVFNSAKGCDGLVDVVTAQTAELSRYAKHVPSDSIDDGQRADVGVGVLGECLRPIGRDIDRQEC